MFEEENKLLSQYGEIKSIVKQIFYCIDKRNKQKQDSLEMLKELKNNLIEIQNIQDEIKEINNKEWFFLLYF